MKTVNIQLIENREENIGSSWIPFKPTKSTTGSKQQKHNNMKTGFTFRAGKPMLFLTMLLAIMLGVVQNGLGQTGTQTLTTSGTFTVPVGVTIINVECWGGGGAGGGTNNTSRTTGGGGGGGTYTSSTNIAVTPGAGITFTIGAGGTGSSNAVGGTGGTTTFNSTTAVSAVGGFGGGVGNGSSLNGAGAGVRTGTTYNGGAGGTGDAVSGTSGTSGGGGGGAGSGGSGNAIDPGISGGTGGIQGTGSSAGGNGANGTNTSGSGVAATNLAAGGSGGRNSGTSASNRTGGNGFRGQIVVKWTCPSATISYASSSFCKSDATPKSPTINGSIGGTFSASPAGLTISSSTGAITPSSSTLGIYTVHYLITGTGGCSNVDATFQVTILGPATANAGLDDIVCSAAPDVTLAGAIGGSATGATWSGGTGTFSPSNTTLNATYSPSAAEIAAGGSITLTLTTTGPCASASDQMLITINLEASANAGIDQTICSSSIVSLTGSMSGTGVISSTWTTSGTGTFGNAANLNTTYTPSVTDITTGTVTLTLTTNNPAGPCGAASDFMIVTINPKATVNAGADQIVCSTSPNVTLAGAIGGSATSATWSGGTGTFSPGATALDATYIPSSAEITAGGNITLTLTTDDPAGVCPVVSDQMIVTIDVAATANAGADQTICSSSVVSLSGLISGTDVTSSIWTTSGNGAFVNALNLSTIYTPSADDILSGTVTLTLTTNDPAGPCVAAADFMVVTIQPAATVSAGADQTVCSASPDVTLAGVIGGSASSATWTGGAGTFNPDNTTLTAIYTPTAEETAAGTVTLTLTTNDPAGVCLPVSDQMVITIDHAATVNAGIDQSVCPSAIISLAGSISGTDVTSSTWTTNGSGTFGNVSNLNTTYTPSASDIAAGTLILTLTTNDPSGPCGAGSDNMTITFTAGAIANAGADQTVCSASPEVQLAGVIGGTATGALWSGGNGTFIPDNTAVDAKYTPSGDEITAGIVTLTLTANDPGSCTATDNMVITINQAATANAGIDQTICSSSEVLLNGSISGTGVTSATWTSAGLGTFGNASILNTTYTPSAEEIAARTVTLTLTTNEPTGPCGAASDFIVVTIEPAATVNAGADQTVCSTSPDVTLDGAIGGSATSATWSGGTGTFSPNATTLTATYIPSPTEIAAGGNIFLTLTTDDPAGVCLAVSDQIIVTIDLATTANAGVDQTICEGSVVTLAGTRSGTGVTSSTWTSSSGTGTFGNASNLNTTYTPSAEDIAAGTVTITLTTNVPAGPCAFAADQMVVTIHALPAKFNVSGTARICSGTSADIALSGSQSGVEYQLRNNSGNSLVGSPVDGTGSAIVLPSGSLISTTTFNVLATNKTTFCPVEMTGTASVAVDIKPVTAFTGTPLSITAGETVTFTDQSTNSPSIWSWSFPGGTASSTTDRNPSVTYNLAGTYSVSLTASNMCIGDILTKPAYVTVSKLANPLTFAANGNFKVPPGVTCVKVEAWGGGGAGGGVIRTSNGGTVSAGGGAGGAYSSRILSLVSGNSYTVTVAASKTSTTNSSAAANIGYPSWFGTSSTLYAEGGPGGTPAGNNQQTAGGTGSSSISIGDVVMPGGNGSSGNTGSTGSTGGQGGNGGGDGGIAVSGNSAGNAGTAPGGGGSGARAVNSNTFNGGTGAAGQVIVSWIDTYDFHVAATSPVCATKGTIVTVTSSTLANGNYTVTYNTTNPTATSNTATMAFSGGTGSFITSALNGPSSVVTVTGITFTGWTCSTSITENNFASVAVTALPATPVITPPASTAICTTGGGSVVLSSSASTGSYQWYKDLAPINLENSKEYTATAVGSYTVVVTENSCESAASAPVAVTSSVPAIAIDQTSTATCFNSAVDQTSYLAFSGITNSPAKYKITWNPAMADVPYTDLPIVSPISITVPATTAVGTYTGTLTVKTADECVSLPASFTLTVKANPVATFSYGSSQYCKKLTTNPVPIINLPAIAGTFSATPAGLAFVSTGTGIIDLTNSSPNTYTVTNTVTANGCTTEYSTQVTIRPLPAATISYAGSPYCYSIATPQSVTVTGTGDEVGTYSVSPAIGLAIDSYGAITPYSSTPGTYTVTFTFNIPGSCFNTTQATVIIEEVTDVPVTVQTTPICSGTSTNIKVGLSVAGTTYQLRIGTSDITGSYALGNDGEILLPTGNLSNTTPFNVLATNTSGCSKQLTATPTVVISEKPTAIIATPPTAPVMCANGTYTVSGAIASPITGIKWTSSGKGTLTNETSLTPTYTASSDDAGSSGGYVTLTMTVSNSPCDPAVATNEIWVYPTPGIYMGASSLCIGASTYVSPVGSGSWVSLNPTVATVNSATGIVNALSGGNATFQYTETLSNCSVTTSTLTVDAQCQEITLTEPAPLTSVITGGTLTSCSGYPVPITVTFVGGTAPYTVSYTGDGIPHTTTESSITFNVNPTATVTLSSANVLVTDYHSCTSLPTGSYQIVVRPIPTATIGGDTELCLNSPEPTITFSNQMDLPVIVTYKINTGTDLTINIGSLSSATLTAPTDIAGTFDYNLVNVYYTDGAPGCITTLIRKATVIVDPLIAGNVLSTPDPICYGFAAVIGSLAPPTGGNGSYSYSWESSTDGTNFAPIAGAGQTYTATDPLYVDTYYRRTVVSNGCSDVSQPVLQAINPLPAAVSVSGDGTYCNSAVITADNGLDGKMYFQGMTFEGISTARESSTETVTETGVYYFRALSDKGCWSEQGSATITINPPPPATGSTIQYGTSNAALISPVCAPSDQISVALNAGTGTSVAGTGTVNWLNPTNVKYSDGSYSTVVLNTNVTSRYLKGLSYTNSYAIPPNAVITGITVNVNRTANAVGIKDDQVSLVKGSSVPAGIENKKKTNDWFGTSGTVTYGGPNDLWSTTWTPAEINANTFGAVVSATNTGSSAIASVDQIQVVVTYNIPGVPEWYTAASSGTLLTTGSPFNPVGFAGSGVTTLSPIGSYPFYVQCSLTPGCRSEAILTIGKADPVITWSDPQNIVYGTTLSAIQLNAEVAMVNGQPLGTITYEPGLGTLLDAGSHTLKVTVEGTDIYNTVSKTVTINVDKAPLTVVNTSRSKVYGQTLTDVDYTGSITGIVSNDNITVTRASVGDAADARVTGSPYPIVATFVDPDNKLGNYNVVNPNGELTVTKATITVVNTNRSKVYGQVLTNADYSGSITGVEAGDNITVTRASVGDPANATVAGSPYPIVGTLVDPDGRLDNYNVINPNGVLTVTRATITVVNDNRSKVYGQVLTNADYTGSITGVEAGDIITVTRASTGDATDATIAGSPYPIVATFIDPDGRLGNYNVINPDGALTVTKATITVVNNNRSKVYGQVLTNSDYTGSITGVEAGDNITVTRASLGDAANATVTGSPYPIVATFVDPDNKLGNYNIVNPDGVLTVTKATITVVNTDRSKVYGQVLTNSDYTGSITGVEAGDNITITRASLGDAANATVTGSPYPIVATFIDPDGRLGNYNVINPDGVLTVTKAMITVVNNNKTKVYGQVLTNADYTGSITGVEAGDNITVTRASVGDVAGATVAGSPYVIVGTLVDPDGRLDNYTVEGNINAELTVTKAKITVVNNNKTKVYGQVLTNADYSGSITGVEAGDNITVTRISVGDAANATVAGSPYPIVGTLVDLDGRLDNYTVESNVNAELTVTRATITVVNDNRSKVYGQVLTNADYTGSITGVKAGDIITVTRASTGDATDATIAGSPYPIVATFIDPDGRLGNYNVINPDGALTVTKATITVVNNNRSKVYGQVLTNSDYTGSITGVEAGDNITVTRASLGDAANATVTGSPYPIVATFVDPDNKLGNYNIVNPDGVLTVTKATITVVNTDRSKVYGQVLTNSDYTGSITGVEAGDNITITRASLGDAANATVTGSPYPIVATFIDPDGRLGNYNVINPDGVLTVTKAMITVVNNNKTKVYGQVLTNADYTGSITGVEAGDNITVTRASVGDVAGATVAGSPYVIVGTLVDPDGRLDNYTVEGNINAELTVTKADQTITVSNHAPAYADFMETFTVSASASSGLPVAYTSTFPLTNIGTNYTMNSGDVTLTGEVIYNQAGNENYNPANEIIEYVKAGQASISIEIVTQTDVLCFGGNNGSITLLASSVGNPEFNYSWTKTGGGFSASTATISNLMAGIYNYTVTVNGVNYEPVSGSVTINQPTELLATISNQTNVNCFGDPTGSVTVTATPGAGTSPYQYKFESGSYSGVNTFGTLAAGNYTVTVKDANGCTLDVPVTITQPTMALSATKIETGVKCNGAADGSVTVSGNGGTSPYTYSINGVDYQNSGFFGALAFGTYTVTVKDAKGCAKDIIVSISQPDVIVVGESSTTNVSCYSGTNGSITLGTVSGGTVPYSYSWVGSDGSIPTSQMTERDPSGLSAGIFIYTVKDANGCAATGSVEITQPTALVANISSQTNIDCFGNNTGSVTVDGSGGTPGYEYTIDGGSYQASGTFSSLGYGDHTVTVKDVNGCSRDKLVTITQPSAALSATFTKIDATCYGTSTGSVTVTGNGGTPVYQYSINGVAYLNSGTFGSLAAGNYSVTVKDFNGCTFNVTGIIIGQPAEKPPVSVSIVASANPVCEGTPVTFTATAVNGGVSPSYQWNVNGTNVGTNSATYSYTPANNDVIVCTVTSYEACATGNPAISSAITMTINAIPTIAGTTSGNRCATGTVVLGATASAGTINWYDGISGGVSLGTGTSFTTPSIATTTTYYVDATNNGCTTVPRIAVIAMVNPLPALPVAGANTYTYDGTSKTAAATVGINEVIFWFTAQSGGIATTAPSATNAGTYTAYAEARNTITGCVSPSRTLVTLTINKAVLTITAQNQSVTFGTLVATVLGSGTHVPTGFVQSENSSVIGGTATYTTTYTETTPAGTGCIITPVITGLTATNYSFTPANGTVTVTGGTKPTLTVTAESKYKHYGDRNPDLTYTITGFVNGENLATSGVTGRPILSTTARRSSDVGPYPITITRGTLASSKYNFAFVNGTLDVGKITLRVHADNRSKHYGDVNPSLTYSITGFVNGENLATSGVTGNPGINTTATASSPVGSYPITVTIGSLSSLNYDFHFDNGTLTVSKATLTVTADNKFKTYRTANPPLTATITGFVNGETRATSGVTGNPGLFTSATTNSPVGTYTITASLGSLASSNYNFTFVSGTLTIARRATLTVTANNLSRPYGSGNPALTVTYTGFVNGETLATSGVTGSPSVTTTATTGSPAGPYTITVAQGSLASTRYNFAFVDGTLTVDRATLTITANNRSKTYGTSVTFDMTTPSADFTVTGLKLSDAVNSITLASGGSATGANVAGSPYTITPAAAAGTGLGNYTIGYVNGLLTVNPASLTITPNSGQTKVYGSLDPAFNYTHPAIVGDVTGAMGRVPGENVGPYAFTLGTLTAGANYSLSIAATPTFRITPLPVTVRANNQTKRHGSSDPALTFVSNPAVGTHLANGQEISFSGSLTRRHGEAVGTYPISIGSLQNSNYTIAFTGANLTITPRFRNITGAGVSSDSTVLQPSENVVIKGEIGLNVYPNPFTDHLYFDLQLQADANVVLEVYNINGTKLARVFSEDVKALTNYRIEYSPQVVSSQILVYRLFINGKIYFTGKAIHK